MLEKIKLETYSHMPFLTVDEEDREILFLCLADADGENSAKIWKLHYINADCDGPIKINTTLSNNTIECSPTAWRDDNGWHISFIAGGDSTNPKFCLYLLEGDNLNNLNRLTLIQQYAGSGFVNSEETLYTQKTVNGDLVISSIPNTVFSLNEILRVSYQSDDKSVLLISYKKNGTIYTLRYNRTTNLLERVLCDGLPAYKFTIYKNKVIYAKMHDDEFENRKLTLAKTVDYIPLAHFP